MPFQECWCCIPLDILRVPSTDGVVGVSGRDRCGRGGCGIKSSRRLSYCTTVRSTTAAADGGVTAVVTAAVIATHDLVY